MRVSLEEKVGQRLGVGFDGLEPPPYLLEWLRAGRVGALVLFSRNVASPQQVKDLIAACQEAARVPLLVGVDQEGGTVARLREGFTEAPSALALGAADSAKDAEAVAFVLAAEMRAVGINWTLAPVVDLTHDMDNPSVGTRSFGSRWQSVGKLASAQARGFRRGGVLATAKHFPGLGRTPVDTHEAMATIGGSIDDLRSDIRAFERVIEADVDSVMMTHVCFPALDPTNPATLSRAIATDLLRSQLGFHGFTCTDCMEMRAIIDHYGAGESAVLAALAGIDLILFSQTRERQEQAYNALLDATRSGRLPAGEMDASLNRIFAAKQSARSAPQPPLDVIRSADHLRLTREAAEKGTVLLRADSDDFPLHPDDGRKVALIEFASYLDTPAIERGETSSFAALLQQEAPQIESVSLRYREPDAAKLERARRLAAESDLLILTTRSAHINDDQLARARELIGLAKRVVLICLRAPYDASLFPEAQTILCACGDSTPSLEAAVGALLGRFAPSGRLPVAVMPSTPSPRPRGEG